MTKTTSDGEQKEKCWRCAGDGYFWRLPSGFNPFAAGGLATSRAMQKVHCFDCNGTGIAAAFRRQTPKDSHL